MDDARQEAGLRPGQVDREATEIIDKLERAYLSDAEATTGGPSGKPSRIGPRPRPSFRGASRGGDVRRPEPAAVGDVERLSEFPYVWVRIGCELCPHRRGRYRAAAASARSAARDGEIAFGPRWEELSRGSRISITPRDHRCQTGPIGWPGDWRSCASRRSDRRSAQPSGSCPALTSGHGLDQRTSRDHVGRPSSVR